MNHHAAQVPLLWWCDAEHVAGSFACHVQVKLSILVVQAEHAGWLCFMRTLRFA
jgi:hypothetical protein